METARKRWDMAPWDLVERSRSAVCPLLGGRQRDMPVFVIRIAPWAEMAGIALPSSG